MALSERVEKRIEKLSKEDKQYIDNLSQLELCRIWRFGDNEQGLTLGVTGNYLKKVLFEEKGGFTPQISKKLGW